MKIARSAAKERIILDTLRASFNGDGVRTGVHLSDLIKVRQAHWGRIMPIPPSDVDCLYFLAGRGHEEVFARLCGVQAGATEVKHVPVPGLVTGEQRFVRGISFRPDFYWYDAPAEFKTRRANLPKPGEESWTFDNYLEQLKGYCALGGVNQGHLLVLSLLEGRSGADPLKPTQPELAVYDVEFHADELVNMNAYLDQQKGLLEKSTMAAANAMMRPTFVGLQEAAKETYAKLPLCSQWMCGKQAVSKPAHCVECDKDLSGKFADNHTNTKTGAGHTVTPAEWAYAPRCKHYVFCRPQDVDPQRGAR